MKLLRKMMKLFVLTIAVLSFIGINAINAAPDASKAKSRQGKKKKDAVVTLVAGDMSGYEGGAVALGQSLIDVGSELHRVILVTPEVC
jgi:competence protein ComGC